MQSICLVFNKMDSSLAMDPLYLIKFFDLKNLLETKTNLHIELVSGLTGGNCF